MKILGEICVLSLIYSYISVCRFCAVCYLITICCSLLFSNYSTCVVQYSFYVCFVFYFAYFVFLYCLSFSTVSPIFVQVHQPLPLGGIPIAVNKYCTIPKNSASLIINE